MPVCTTGTQMLHRLCREGLRPPARRPPQPVPYVWLPRWSVPQGIRAATGAIPTCHMAQVWGGALSLLNIPTIHKFLTCLHQFPLIGSRYGHRSSHTFLACVRLHLKIPIQSSRFFTALITLIHSLQPKNLPNINSFRTGRQYRTADKPYSPAP